MEPKGSQRAQKHQGSAQVGHLGDLGLTLSALGALLVRILALLGRLWRSFGRSWRAFGRFWCALGRLRGVVGGLVAPKTYQNTVRVINFSLSDYLSCWALLARTWSSWCALGGLLVRSWGSIGRFGRSWCPFARSWVALGRSCINLAYMGNGKRDHI